MSRQLNELDQVFVWCKYDNYQPLLMPKLELVGRWPGFLLKVSVELLLAMDDLGCLEGNPIVLTLAFM